jgi:hypothetical protein
VHPINLLSEEELAILDCFMVWRGGLAGNGPLPFSGGYAEQPSALVSALRHMAGYMHQLKPKR